MKISTQRTVSWIVVNIILATMVWFGVVNGVDGAGNVVIGWSWFALLVSFGTYSSDVVRKTAADGAGRAVSAPVQAITEFAFAGVLVWFGWFWTAAVIVLTYANMQAYWNNVEMYQRQENDGE